MFSEWKRPAFYILLLIQLIILVGALYWELTHQTSPAVTSGELLGGWAFLFFLGWQAFFFWAVFTIRKSGQVGKSELVIALLTLSVLAFGFVWVS